MAVRSFSVLVLLQLFGCSPLTKEPASNAKPVLALLQISAFGSQGVFPVPVANPSSAARTITGVSYDLTLSDREVTRGTERLEREVPPGKDTTVNVVIPLKEEWLLATPSFTKTGAVPFRLRGAFEQGASSAETFDVSGTLRLRASTPPAPGP